jgi:hypothetical protein
MTAHGRTQPAPKDFSAQDLNTNKKAGRTRIRETPAFLLCVESLFTLLFRGGNR